MRNTRLDDVPIQEALDQWSQSFTFRRETETLPIAQARGRMTAEPVRAQASTPPYPAAAMDGIALRAEAVSGASPSFPVQLREGRDFTYINTGDPLPRPWDTVIMIEKVTEIAEGWVEVTEPSPPWKHVRQPGEDVAQGELVLPDGHRVRPVDMGALLAAGVERVAVLRRPRVAILPTGSEMVPPGTPMQRGQLREFNGTAFAGYLEEWGAEPVYRGIVPDRRKAIRHAISEAVNSCDIVVVNAGSSAGSQDYTPQVLREMGEVLLHGVAARPGRPVVLAVVRGTPVVGIPGYPVSAYLSLDWFVRPLIDQWYGQESEVSPTLSARLIREVRTKTGAEDFVRMQVACVDGQYVAAPLPRGAGVTLSMVRADGWLRVPPSSTGYPAGERVELELARSPQEVEKTLFLTGTDDPLLEELGALMARQPKGWSLAQMVTGERDGLNMLQQRECHGVAVDGEGWSEVVPSDSPSLIQIYLAEREIGWITAPGIQVRQADDLLQPGLTFINRPAGTETRRRLERALAGSYPSDWERSIPSLWKAAAAVGERTADVTIGPRSVAQELGLDWMPLWREPFSLILPEEVFKSPAGQALLKILRSEAFTHRVAALGGSGSVSWKVIRQKGR